MRGFVVVFVYRSNRYLTNGDAVLCRIHQHIHFIFVTVTFDGKHGVEKLRGKSPKTGLGITAFFSGGNHKHKLRDGVTESGAKGNFTFKFSDAQYESLSVFKLFTDSCNIASLVLSVSIDGNDSITAGNMIADICDSVFKGGTLSLIGILM